MSCGGGIRFSSANRSRAENKGGKQRGQKKFETIFTATEYSFLREAETTQVRQVLRAFELVQFYAANDARVAQ